MTDADTRERLEALQGDPEELWSWIEALIEQGDPRLPEVARWAAEGGDVELLMSLMDDYVVSSHLRTVDSAKSTVRGSWGITLRLRRPRRFRGAA